MVVVDVPHDGSSALHCVRQFLGLGCSSEALMESRCTLAEFVLTHTFDDAILFSFMVLEGIAPALPSDIVAIDVDCE